MFCAVVIYAPDDAQMRRIASTLAEAATGKKCSVTLKPAGGAAIPALAGAELIIFASRPEGRQDIHPDFSELVRGLAGVNLAGRVGGILATSPKALSAFKEALKDSELILGEDGCLLVQDAAAADRGGLFRWVEALVDRLHKIAHGR